MTQPSPTAARASATTAHDPLRVRRILEVARRAGMLLLASGAQTTEVEDSIRNLASDLGLEGVQVGVLFSSIQLSYVEPGRSAAHDDRADGERPDLRLPAALRRGIGAAPGGRRTAGPRRGRDRARAHRGGRASWSAPPRGPRPGDLVVGAGHPVRRVVDRCGRHLRHRAARAAVRRVAPTDGPAAVLLAPARGSVRDAPRRARGLDRRRRGPRVADDREPHPVPAGWRPPRGHARPHRPGHGVRDGETVRGGADRRRRRERRAPRDQPRVERRGEPGH